MQNMPKISTTDLPVNDKAASPSHRSVKTSKTDGKLSLANQLEPKTNMMRMDHPIIEVSGQKHSGNLVLSQAAYSRGFNTKEQASAQQHDFAIVKPDIITGENKWREEVQKHKERLEEARRTQQARFTNQNELQKQRELQQVLQESLEKQKKHK